MGQRKRSSFEFPLTSVRALESEFKGTRLVHRSLSWAMVSPVRASERASHDDLLQWKLVTGSASCSCGIGGFGFGIGFFRSFFEGMVWILEPAKGLYQKPPFLKPQKITKTTIFSKTKCTNLFYFFSLTPQNRKCFCWFLYINNFLNFDVLNFCFDCPLGLFCVCVFVFIFYLFFNFRSVFLNSVNRETFDKVGRVDGDFLDWKACFSVLVTLCHNSRYVYCL